MERDGRSPSRAPPRSRFAANGTSPPRSNPGPGPRKTEERMFEGLSVAMVTHFRRGELDLEGSARLIEFMLEGGVEVLVVSGSTGEAATCSVEERRSLWRFVRERVAGRIPVVAGTGTNSTADSIALTRMAEEIGLDGA